MKRLSPRISIAALVLMSISIGLVVHAANRDDGTGSSDPIPVVRPDGMDYDPFSHQRNSANPSKPRATSELQTLNHGVELFPPTTEIPSPESNESRQGHEPGSARDRSNLSATELIRLPSIHTEPNGAPSESAPELIRLPQVATDDQQVDRESEEEQTVRFDQDDRSNASHVGWPSFDNETISRLPTVASDDSRVVTAGGAGTGWTESELASASDPAVVAESETPPYLNPLPALPPSLRFHEDSAVNAPVDQHASPPQLAVSNQAESTSDAATSNPVDTPPTDSVIQLTNDSITRTLRGESFQEPARWEPFPNIEALAGTVDNGADQSIAAASSNGIDDDRSATEFSEAVSPTQPPTQLPEGLTQATPVDDPVASRSESAPLSPVRPSTDASDVDNGFIIPPISLPPSDLATDRQMQSEANLDALPPNNPLGLGVIEEVADTDESRDALPPIDQGLSVSNASRVNHDVPTDSSETGDIQLASDSETVDPVPGREAPLDANLAQQNVHVDTSPNPGSTEFEIPTITPSEYRAQAGDEVNSAFQSFLDEQNAVVDNHTQSGALSDTADSVANMAEARRPLPQQNVLRLDHHVPEEGFSPTVIRATDSVYAAHDPFAPAHLLASHENISDGPSKLDPPSHDIDTSASESAVEVALDEGSPSDRVIPVIRPSQAPQRISVSEPIRINSPSEPLVLRDPIRSNDQSNAGRPSGAPVQTPTPRSTSDQVTSGPDFVPPIEHRATPSQAASTDPAATPSLSQIAPPVVVETLDQELASNLTEETWTEETWTEENWNEENEMANARQQTAIAQNAIEQTRPSSRDNSTRQFVPLSDLPGFMADSSAQTSDTNSLAHRSSFVQTNGEPLKPLTNSDIAASREGSADSSRSPSDRASVTNPSQANPVHDASQSVETAQLQTDPSNRRVGTLLTQQSQSNFPAESSVIAPISNLQDVAPLPLSQDGTPDPDTTGALSGPMEFDPLDDELLSDPFTGSNPCPVGCPPKYYWMTDIVAYQPNYGDLSISNVVSTDQSFFREGGRVTFGFRGDCLFGWEATLLQLTSASEISSSTTQGVGGPLGTRWIPTGGFTNASLSSFNSPFAQIHLQDHRLEFTSFELHRTTWGWDVLNTSYGLRIMSFHEEVLFGSSNTAQAIETMPGLFAQSAQNTLIGPQVGITLIDNSRNTLTYDAKGKFGVYADIMDLDTLYQNNSTILLRRNNVEDVGVAFSIEFTSGVSWNLTPNWKIRAGVDALYIHGLATLRDQLMPAPAPNTGGALLSNGLGSIISSDDGVFFLGGTIGLYGNWP